MKKIMIDTNIVDCIVAEEGLSGRLQNLHHSGRLTILTTHIQQDEIGETPDTKQEHRKKLQEAIAKIAPQVVPTKGFVLGRSRLGLAALGDGESIDRFRKGNIEHTEDALIASTAETKADVLVTENTKHFKRSRIKALGFQFELWDFKRFLEHIDECEQSDTANH